MPKYKLIYFNLRGRAEILRLIFAVAGQEYEDVRITGKEWQSLKQKTPQGGLPILEIESDGKKKVIPQGMAICRHLARTFGLYGKTKQEMADVDLILETFVDMRTQLYTIHTEIQKDQAKKDELEKKIRTEIIPKFLSIFDGIAKSNECRSHYLVGDSLTVADLAVFEIFWTIRQRYENVLDLAKYLKRNYQTVSEHCRLKAWIEKRPKNRNCNFIWRNRQYRSKGFDILHSRT